MKKQWKIAVALLAGLIVFGGGAAYWFTLGPGGQPVLASVNGETITLGRFQQELERIDPAYREMARQEPEKFLEILINQTLLLQEAKKAGVALPPGEKPAAGTEAETVALIEAYLATQAEALPPATAAEVEQIYETYRDQLAGRSREEATALIKGMIEEQRRGEAVDRLIDGLRRAARIDIRQPELQKLSQTVPGLETQSEEDFRKALAGGKPAIVDFGSNSCLPCRQLRPVLEKVRTDYAGKLEVLIIDVRDHGKLAAEYEVRVIPTVIFFDAGGKEVVRHQGFMSEEKIKGELAKLGMV
jgi:thioredoxin 1